MGNFEFVLATLYFWVKEFEKCSSCFEILNFDPLFGKSKFLLFFPKFIFWWEILKKLSTYSSYKCLQLKNAKLANSAKNFEILLINFKVPPWLIVSDSNRQSWHLWIYSVYSVSIHRWILLKKLLSKSHSVTGIYASGMSLIACSSVFSENLTGLFLRVFQDSSWDPVR